MYSVTLSEAKSLSQPKAVLHCGRFFVVSLLRMTGDGNSAYQTARLVNPANDAKDMARTLKKLSFKVALTTNATQGTMEKSLRACGKKLRKGGVGLFYYAGHGIQVKGRNYLIPIGAILESEADAKYEARWMRVWSSARWRMPATALIS